jgi:hypothetical protein
MCEVMRHLVNTFGWKPGEVPGDVTKESLTRKDAFVKIGCDGIHGIQLSIRRVVESMCDFVDVFDGDAELGKTIRRRFHRELSGMFPTIKPLLSSRGNQIAV